MAAHAAASGHALMEQDAFTFRLVPPTWALRALERHADLRRALQEHSMFRAGKCILPCPEDGRDLPYARLPIYSSPGVEAVLIAWRPHKACEIHDHGGGGGQVFVLHGRLRERRWRDASSVIAGDPPTERSVSAGDVIPVDRCLVHAMANLDDAPGLTLHVYEDVCRPMHVLIPDDHATYQVPDDHGAFRPQPHERLERMPWPRR